MSDEKKPLPVVNARTLSDAQARIATLEKKVSNLEGQCAGLMVSLSFAVVGMGSKPTVPFVSDEQLSIVRRAYRECLVRIIVSPDPLKEAVDWVEANRRYLGIDLPLT